MVLHAGAAATQPRTKIKILNSPTMRCDVAGCGHQAAYLFRTGNGPIHALCDAHAGESASRLGVPLPKSMVQVLRMGSILR
jgi:hypothetical protein